MSGTKISDELKEIVRNRASGQCEYCKISDGGLISHHVDHVIAEQHDGETHESNLAWSCAPCNKKKGPNIASVDPQSAEKTFLFNPRTQNWPDHFQVTKDGEIEGLTPEGRATAKLLDMNDPTRIRDRQVVQQSHIQEESHLIEKTGHEEDYDYYYGYEM